MLVNRLSWKFGRFRLMNFIETSDKTPAKLYIDKKEIIRKPRGKITLCILLRSIIACLILYFICAKSLLNKPF